MRVLLCGINPSLWSGLVGYHFARPSNRLWPVLHEAGFTPRRLYPSETDELVAARLGVTNLVARATARADELTAAEIRAGLAGRDRTGRAPGSRRTSRSSACRRTGSRPVNGRPASGHRSARSAPPGVWLLPNPSGLNASYQMPALIEAYAALRQAAYS